MGLNFIDCTAQILFSDLLRRSDDLTDTRVKAIADTAYRRAVMLSEVRKDYVSLESKELSNVSNLKEVDWVEHKVDKDCCKREECKCEEDTELLEEEVEKGLVNVDGTPYVEEKKKRDWTKKVKVAASTSETAEPPKKRGRPKGSGKKKTVI